MGSTICIFCGSSGADIKITGEHTFSDWINTVLPTSVVGPEISYELSVRHGTQAGTSRTWPAREVASHRLRNVCTDCNSGWMHRAEEAVARSSHR